MSTNNKSKATKASTGNGVAGNNRSMQPFLSGTKQAPQDGSMNIDIDIVVLLRNDMLWAPDRFISTMATVTRYYNTLFSHEDISSAIPLVGSHSLQLQQQQELMDTKLKNLLAMYSRSMMMTVEAASSTSSSTDANTNLEAISKECMTKWELKCVPNKGVGLVATQPIEVNELVISVPCGMMLSMSNTTSTIGANANSTTTANAKKIYLPPVMHTLLHKFNDNPTFQLAVLLLFCRSQGKDSFFYDYIAALPGYLEGAGEVQEQGQEQESHAPTSSYSQLTTPLYWNQDALAHLRDACPHTLFSRVSNSIRASLILYIRLYNELAALVKAGEAVPPPTTAAGGAGAGGSATSDKNKNKNKGSSNSKLQQQRLIQVDDYSWELFRWAISVVMSRQNIVPCGHVDEDSGSNSTETETELALVPLWDLMNHAFLSAGDDNSTGPSASAGTGSPAASHIAQTQTHYNSLTNTIDYRTPIAVLPGTEISMFYGPRANTELLIYSGFCVPQNPYEAVSISLATLLFLHAQLPAEEACKYVFKQQRQSQHPELEQEDSAKYDKIKGMIFKAYTEGTDDSINTIGSTGNSTVASGSHSALPYPSAWRKCGLHTDHNHSTDTVDGVLVTVSTAAVVDDDVSLLSELPFGLLYACFLHICSDKTELSQLLRLKPRSLEALMACTTVAGMQATVVCAMTALDLLLEVGYKSHQLGDREGINSNSNNNNNMDEDKWCYVDADTTTARSLPNTPVRPVTPTAVGNLPIFMMDVLRKEHVEIIKYYKQKLEQYQQKTAVMVDVV